jgi:hypothetical protein
MKFPLPPDMGIARTPLRVPRGGCSKICYFLRGYGGAPPPHLVMFFPQNDLPER